MIVSIAACCVVGSGHPLQFGKLVALPPKFVPPNSARDVPLNKILKNNFWNSAHVLNGQIKRSNRSPPYSRMRGSKTFPNKFEPMHRLGSRAFRTV